MQDRVRANTTPQVNQRIDEQIERNIRHFAGRTKGEIFRRIDELEKEWDIERVLETMAPTLSLAGIALGASVDKRWLLLPATVLSFLLLHAIQGWCPPIPVLRRLGVRTKEEIERERYALKTIGGDDFDAVGGVERILETLK